MFQEKKERYIPTILSIYLKILALVADQIMDPLAD